MNFINTDEPEKIYGCGLNAAQIESLVAKLDIKDLNSRPIYLEPAAGTRLPSNAVIVAASYPFGFSGRCVRVLFSEWRNKQGYRTVTATSNKYHTGWNALKKGTYSMGVDYFTWDEKGHAQSNHFRLNLYDALYYAQTDFEAGNTANRDKVTRFREQYFDVITEHDKKTLDVYLNIMDKKTAKLKEFAI